MNTAQAVVVNSLLLLLALLLHVFFCEWNDPYGTPVLFRLGDELRLHSHAVSSAWGFAWGVVTPLVLVGAALCVALRRRSSDGRRSLGVGEVEAHIRELSSPDDVTRRSALRVLALRSPTRPTALPLLIDLLESSSSWERSLALSGIGRYGRRARAAVPRLVRLLRESDAAATRLSVLRTLAAIGPAAIDALSALEELEPSDDPRLRCWRREAIESILSPEGPDAPLPGPDR